MYKRIYGEVSEREVEVDNMKNLYCLLIIGFFFSCNNRTIGTENVIEKSIPYFTFDSIEHYYLEVDSKGVSDIEKKKELTEDEKEQMYVMYEDTSNVLADTMMYQYIERINFIKTSVSKDKFDTINKIFCSRSLGECVFTTCIPVYRDILIFKNKNKTVGIAKICFQCKESLMIGTSDKTRSLCLQEGYDYIDDYTRLKEILYSK